MDTIKILTIVMVTSHALKELQKDFIALIPCVSTQRRKGNTTQSSLGAVSI